MNTDRLAGAQAAAGLAVHGAPPASARPELIDGSAPGLDARELLPLIAELHEELGDLTDVMVTGPALAARAITRSLLGEPRVLERTVVVTDAIPPDLWQDYLDSGLTPAEARRHFVLIDQDLPSFGSGVFSAATLVPAALAGADVAQLLEEAELFAGSLSSPTANPAVALALAVRQSPVELVSEDPGFGEWATDLLDGIVPLGPGGLTITIGGPLPPASGVAVHGPLGAQFLCWERAAAIARTLTD